MVTNMHITMSVLFQKLVKYFQLEAEYWTAVNCCTTIRRIYDLRITHRPSIGCSTEQSLNSSWSGFGVPLLWERNLWPPSFGSASHRAAACLQLHGLNQLQMFLPMNPLGDLGSGEANCENNTLCARARTVCAPAWLHTFLALWLWPINLLTARWYL